MQLVCEHCGNLLRDDATVCDQCGAQIHAPRRGEGASARRQGRAERPRQEYVGSMAAQDEPPMPDAVLSGKRRPRSEGAGRPDSRRGMPPPPTSGQEIRHRNRERQRHMHRMMINWAMVGAISVCVLAALLIGGFVFLKVSEPGQLILARMGRDANATALWTYGQELLDQGYVDRSIAVFEQAYEQEPEREDIYDRLQQLADAYEAAGRTGSAEEIYTRLYTEIEPENPVAYWAVVRIMENQERLLELSAFLKTAYEKTGEVSFRRQREDLVPATPTTDLEAGSLMRERDVALSSKEDYDIYYLLGTEGTLPEDGALYTGPIHLSEGTHILRAVAVSSELISDELSVQYTINLPVPNSPLSSLQPGEYERRQRIWLRYVESDEEKNVDDPKQKDITIYYTIDGQTPTSNSPIYTGEPFYLPGGKAVVLKAVAVNGYGKVSNVMERQYQINIPFKRYFNSSDEFSDFTLMTTTRDAFVRKYGNPIEEVEIEDATVTGNAVKLNYSWGEARFKMTEKGYVIYAIETTSTSMTGPRKTRVGMKESAVTELYRDMGQTYDQNGDRSLYYDESQGFGKLYHLDSVNDRIDYVYYRTDTGTVTLSFYLENGTVTKIGMKCSYPVSGQP